MSCSRQLWKNAGDAHFWLAQIKSLNFFNFFYPLLRIGLPREYLAPPAIKITGTSDGYAPLMIKIKPIFGISFQKFGSIL
jgi:hypothetical protein